ncbi:alpha/beta fold hydrolase [Streptosporangium roseum]|uniref:alpha/beta fold hydrolase n=1 Tax=Streptosporangium roseum TaxID=2001 RepID=UPI003321692D
MTRPACAVLILHGGRAASRAPTAPAQLTVLRMIPFERAVRRATRGSDVVVSRPRFRLRGWNGAEASPVADLRAAVEGLGVPTVLIGHSMGARAALRMAGHPLVAAVAALAPWLPAGEPVGRLAGGRVLLAHGDRDTVTDPAGTWAYAERARGAAVRVPAPGEADGADAVAAVEVAGDGHAMLRRAGLWHRLAVEFALLSLDRPAEAGPVANAFRRAAAGLPRLVV